MLAKLASAIPDEEGYLFEPKWDGMRCIAARRAGHVQLWSRQRKPLARYFPELVSSLGEIPHEFVADGEVVIRRDDRFDFEALLLRLHPAPSRVRFLSRATPAAFVAFDLLEVDGNDLTRKSFELRRQTLEELAGPESRFLQLSPITSNRDQATRWLHSEAFEGIVGKHRTLLYQPGKRAMVKLKVVKTADCVVAGFRLYQSEPFVGSLLLGIYDADQRLIHVGLATSFTARARQELTEKLLPYVCELEDHPWADGFPLHGGPVGRLPGAGSRWAYDNRLTWVPVRAELVCEVAYDRLDGGVFRHPSRLVRWRPDRSPASCVWDQFAGGEAADAKA